MPFPDYELEGHCDVRQLPASEDGREVLITPDEGQSICLSRWVCEQLAAHLLQYSERTITDSDNRRVSIIGRVHIKVEYVEP